MSFSIGIVGLPNVGKSTLFQALTKKQVNIANYPFCTIEPNVGVVPVPDDRLDKLAKLSHSKKITPTVITFIDIAGLVKNAHKGEGLGNKFLQNIREVDAICQVVRLFEDKDVIHVAGKVDPRADIETISVELAMADLKTVQSSLERVKREMKSSKDKVLAVELELLDKVYTALNAGKPARSLTLEEDEQKLLKNLNLLTTKPMIYVMNVSEDQLPKKDHLPKIDTSSDPQIILSARTEADLIDLSEEEVKEYLKTIGEELSGLDKLIVEAYRILNLISFLTTGETETRAWTIVNGTNAKKAAGKIHSDFEKGFIKAEIIYWKDLLKAGSEQAAREKGLIRTEGKDYIVKDGDCIEFKFA